MGQILLPFPSEPKKHMRNKLIPHPTFSFSFFFNFFFLFLFLACNLKDHHKRGLIMPTGFYASVKDDNALLRHFVQNKSM